MFSSARQNQAPSLLPSTPPVQKMVGPPIRSSADPTGDLFFAMRRAGMGAGGQDKEESKAKPPIRD